MPGNLNGEGITLSNLNNAFFGLIMILRGKSKKINGFTCNEFGECCH